MDMFYEAAEQLPESELEGTSSVAALIQRGVDYLLQGKNAEGIPLLMQAHAQVARGTSEIPGVLEQTINAYVKHTQAQETLLQASKNYAEAEIERKAHLSMLADTLARDSRQNIIPLSTTPRHHYFTYQYRQAAYAPTPVVGADKQSNALPALSISCFGQFVVHREGSALVLCSSRNGQAILRYLVAQTGYRAASDALMEALWPNEEPDVARRRLQVASSALRSSLNQGYDCDPGGGYILCKNQIYQINPSVTLQTDVDVFVRLYQEGQRADCSHAIACYEEACQLYRGPFLVEDIYADWPTRLREQLSQIYLALCGALSQHCLAAVILAQGIVAATLGGVGAHEVSMSAFVAAIFGEHRACPTCCMLVLFCSEAMLRKGTAHGEIDLA